MAETVEYDVAELIDGSVASIEAKLPMLTDSQLTELALRERDGKTRRTLLAAIEAEQAGRAALPGDSGEEQPPVAPGPDDGDDQDGTFADAPMPEPQVNDMAQDLLRERMTALRDAIKAAGWTDDRDVDAILEAARIIGEQGMMPPEGALERLEISADADAQTALVVMFEGALGRPIPALGKLTFEPGDFMIDGEGRNRTLARSIVFPSDVPETQVFAIWLLDRDGAPWSRCGLIAPLPVGAGRQATIPANYLRFDAPVQVKPVQAKVAA